MPEWADCLLISRQRPGIRHSLTPLLGDRWHKKINLIFIFIITIVTTMYPVLYMPLVRLS